MRKTSFVVDWADVAIWVIATIVSFSALAYGSSSHSHSWMILGAITSAHRVEELFAWYRRGGNR